MVFSFLLRGATALYLGDGLRSKQQERAYDQISYDLLAKSLLAGKGYSFETDYYPGFTPANTPTAHWSFLYPLYLAGVYALAGFHPAGGPHPTDRDRQFAGDLANFPPGTGIIQ